VTPVAKLSLLEWQSRQVLDKLILKLAFRVDEFAFGVATTIVAPQVQQLHVLGFHVSVDMTHFSAALAFSVRTTSGAGAAFPHDIVPEAER
jgi:hypothetical protein